MVIRYFVGAILSRKCENWKVRKEVYKGDISYRVGGACRKGWLKPALKMMASTVFVSNNFHLSAHFTLSQIFCPVFTSLCFGILCQFGMMSYDDRVFLEFMACVMRGAIWYHFCNLKT